MLMRLAQVRRMPPPSSTELSRRISERFPDHPFRGGVNKDNFEAVSAEYLAMSIAFPFIQAGAMHETYKAALRAGGDTDKNAEITGAVGAYLVWDEVGGHKLTLESGNEGLLQLPATRRNYHAHWLRKDIRTILGKDVRPHRSAATARYLDELLDGLSDCAKESQRRLHDRVRMPCAGDDHRVVGRGVLVL